MPNQILKMRELVITHGWTFCSLDLRLAASLPLVLSAVPIGIIFKLPSIFQSLLAFVILMLIGEIPSYLAKF